MATRTVALVCGVAAVSAGVFVYRWWSHWREIRELVAKADAEVREVMSSDDGEDLAINHFLDVASEQLEYSKTEAPKRRVRRHCRGLFRKYLIRQIKAKFGTVADTAANRLVLRKYGYDICREHGVIARHIVENLDFAVEAALIPSDRDLVNRAMKHSEERARRKTLLDRLGGNPAPRTVA
jgi:hypothetical protein